MAGPLPDPPELDPSKLAGTHFAKTRRGFEPTEVRSMLGRTADALRVWAERDARMAEVIDDLEKRLEDAEQFDEARVTEALGAETARIVAAAREAAAEIRTQASTEAAELLDSSRAEAERMADELNSAATSDREAARSLRDETETELAAMTAEATSGAQRVMNEAREEASAMREEAAEAAATLTAEAEAGRDEMIEAAAKVLGDRTAEAEEAAAGIRDAAAAELDDARSRSEAQLEDAGTQAAALTERAAADASEITETTRAEGRRMVDEARQLRRQMLQDIAERSRVARQKVEAAKAARGEVLAAVRGVGSEIDRVVSDLAANEQAMRKAADSAAADVPDDVALVVRALEEGLGARENPGEHLADPGDVRDGLADAVTADTDTAGTDTADTGSAGADAGGVDGAGEESEGHQESDAPGEGVPPADDGAPIASVHDLFEKLRADEPAEVDHQSADSEAGTVRAASPVAGGSGTVATAAAARNGGAPAGGEPHGEEMVGLATLPGDPDAADAGGGSHSEIEGADHSARAAADTVATAIATADTAATVTAATAVGDFPEPSDGGDETRPDPLDRRDVLLEPARKLLGRTIKRLVGDEQNEVLDRARRHRRSRIDVEDLLGDDDATERFTERLTDPYLMAAAAGAAMWFELSGGGRDRGEPSIDDVRGPLRDQVVELLELRRAQLRETLETHAESGGDPTDLVDSLRAAYRELRNTLVEELAGDLATGGFAVGTSVAAGPSATWRWVPDNGGMPCADAQDNALEGPIECGGEFPTGDTLPPAHAGCRCILVPAETEVILPQH